MMFIPIPVSCFSLSHSYTNSKPFFTIKYNGWIYAYKSISSDFVFPFPFICMFGSIFEAEKLDFGGFKIDFDIFGCYEV